MSTLTMPTLMVAFQQRANTAVARSQKGTVAFVIRDAAANAEKLALKAADRAMGRIADEIDY